jgi:hypothetical protein
VSISGQETFDGILTKAAGRGVDAVFFSDHDFIDVEYGLPPFKDALKARVKKPSVSTYGVRRYVDEINGAAARFPGLLVFPGVESSAYYHWKRAGTVFTLEDWNKHMVLLGLDADALMRLPTVPNRASWHFDPLKLWPLLLLFPAFALIRGLVFRKAGLVLVVCGVVMTLLNFPFTSPRYSPYEGEERTKPYRDLIDYTHSKGGLIFWAHPEVNERPEIPGFDIFGVKVLVSAPAYYNEILLSDKADGFAYFWEGEKEVGRPGGIWDTALQDYCSGKRAHPVWACGELDYTKEGDAGVLLDSEQNVISAKERTKKAVMESLREGRFYVLKKGNTKAYLCVD